MGMAKGVPVSCLHDRPPGVYTPEKRSQATPPASVVRDLEQIGLKHDTGIEEGCLGLLLDIAREEEAELLVINGEDNGIIIHKG